MSQFDRSLLSSAAITALDERLAAARAEHPTLWARIESEPTVAATLPFVWHCSEFVAAACLRDPALLAELISSGDLFRSLDWMTFRAQLAAAGRTGAFDPLAVLRRFRQRHMVRIAWRDLAGWVDTPETLRELSDLADACIQFAHDAAWEECCARYGVPHGAESGTPQPFIILGMGKLGGRELNYSSDIDLVFLYPEEGATRPQSGTEHSLENAEFFLRLGQRIINLLATKTVDGFVYRVDMRLRPFGDSGRLAISFDSFEDYLQQHGRDWERYAYVKARPVLDNDATRDLHRNLYANVIRPFVYRRYLDFGVFESLREMKAMIAREVARRELQDNIKLGPGGIREIEFIVQSFQLIRGGSDRRLQTQSLGVALPLLAGQKLLPAEAVDELWAAYLFLRRLENRLQEYNDEQTHRLPVDDAGRARLALAMGAGNWDALSEDIVRQRATVSRYFNNIVFGVTERAPVSTEFSLEASVDDLQARIAALGLRTARACAEQLLALRQSGYYRRLDESGRRRLQALLPRMLPLLATYAEPERALARLLCILERIGGRTVYLALLYENDIALRRLVELCGYSQFLADQIADFPLLLDELIDARLFEHLPSRADLMADLATRMESMRSDDGELQIEALRQFQRAAMFRIAVADFSGRLPLMKVSDRLTDLAELIVERALTLAWAQITERHGVPRCAVDGQLRQARVVVIAYGKFGGIELGYGSDLDLVFLHDSAGEQQFTTGPHVVENPVFFARLGQRLVHLLTTHTRAGRLYEVDIRLRPSGKGGLLVQSLGAFAEYQRKEAWTWEHQALLRARAVAGDANLRTAFEHVRLDVLCHAVRRDTLREEVRAMRERMRRELSKAKPGQFDLKQDAGGITDLEFLTQYWVLKWCDRYPPIATFSDNIRQLESLASGNIIAQETVDFLTSTYRAYRQRMHRLALAGGDTVIADSEFVTERARLIELWNREMRDA